MSREYVDALLDTAADGISFDGFSFEGESEYSFRTPAVELHGLSESGVRDLATGSPYVTNWYFWHALTPQKDDRWAFLRWLERADDLGVRERYERLSGGITRTWGQLELTASLAADGRREYRIRHVDDEDDRERERYTDPRRARELATYDDRGRYRPLSTAPTLPAGWEFAGLDPAALVRAVDFFYPATVPNWHRERTGDLDVSHWQETVSRQTGIYQVVQTWDRGEGTAHVEWMAETCCVDSQCLKRREWQYDADTDLETPGGDGEFPCREPCSLVISAARTFTKLDAESPRSYEFELTPSEKAQLEGLIDAVAEGRVDEIRDADVAEPANRYRARFLRASRFDEEGRLYGVPTDPE